MKDFIEKIQRTLKLHKEGSVIHNLYSEVLTYLKQEQKALEDKAEMRKKIAEWFIDGEVGSSSKALACIYLGGIPKSVLWHPLDPNDFRRCILFLDILPEADRVSLIKTMGELNKRWYVISENWETLTALWKEEKGKRTAPKLYDKMKEIGL